MNYEFLNSSSSGYAPQAFFPTVFECNMASNAHPMIHYNLIIRSLIEENQKLNQELG